MQQPTFRKIEAKQFIGMKLSMSLTENRTYELFHKFMPRRSEILFTSTNDVFDIREYSKEYHQSFKPDQPFIKWAAVEVNQIEEVPKGMETFLLEPGPYAVFVHRGLGTDPSTFLYIFTEWLPRSGCQLDQRPHFDIMGSRYRTNDPDSESEIWIPIK